VKQLGRLLIIFTSLLNACATFEPKEPKLEIPVCVVDAVLKGCHCSEHTPISGHPKQWFLTLEQCDNYLAFPPEDVGPLLRRL
jgi:hypothetical protein